jgi:hypothetical protein
MATPTRDLEEALALDMALHMERTGASPHRAFEHVMFGKRNADHRLVSKEVVTAQAFTFLRPAEHPLIQKVAKMTLDGVEKGMSRRAAFTSARHTCRLDCHETEFPFSVSLLIYDLIPKKSR